MHTYLFLPDLRMPIDIPAAPFTMTGRGLDRGHAKNIAAFLTHTLAVNNPSLCRHTRCGQYLVK